jgi:hypothetical protein
MTAKAWKQVVRLERNPGELKGHPGCQHGVRMLEPVNVSRQLLSSMRLSHHARGVRPRVGSASLRLAGSPRMRRHLGQASEPRPRVRLHARVDLRAQSNDDRRKLESSGSKRSDNPALMPPSATLRASRSGRSCATARLRNRPRREVRRDRFVRGREQSGATGIACHRAILSRISRVGGIVPVGGWRKGCLRRLQRRPPRVATPR